MDHSLVLQQENMANKDHITQAMRTTWHCTCTRCRTRTHKVTTCSSLRGRATNLILHRTSRLHGSTIPTSSGNRLSGNSPHPTSRRPSTPGSSRPSSPSRHLTRPQARTLLVKGPLFRSRRQHKHRRCRQRSHQRNHQRSHQRAHQRTNQRTHQRSRLRSQFVKTSVVITRLRTFPASSTLSRLHALEVPRVRLVFGVRAPCGCQGNPSRRTGLSIARRPRGHRWKMG